MRRWLASSLLALLVATGVAHAQPQQPPQQASATVTMSADRTRMDVGEIFRLTVEARVTGAGNVQVELPDLSPFDVISRQVSTPFSLRFGFGGQQQVQSTTRHVLTLRARQTGQITLPPAFVQLGGRRFESNALTFDIGGTPGADPSPQPNPSAGDLPPAHSVDGMSFDPNGFLRTWVDEGEPYVGQQVTVTVYLYLPGSLRGSPRFTQEPTTDGFWVQDLLPPNRQLTPRTQQLNGRTFQVYLLRRFAAFPLQEGELTIGAPAIDIEQRGIFSILGGPQGGSFARTGQPITVTARPLPEDGRPPGDPHVGSLSLEVELDRTQVATGDAVTLTLTATGRGAMQQLRVPDPEADGLRVLAPEVRDAISTPNDIVGGARTMRWLVVPERPGSFTLGPFEVPVLDPRTGRWTVARAAARTLVAAGNAATPTAEPTGDAERPAPEPSSEVTFGPIHTASELARTHESLSSQPWFLGLLGLGPVLFLLGLGVRTAQRRAASEDPKQAPKRARKAAQKRLAAAKEHAKADEPREFYAAIAKALKDVLEAKLGRAVGSLTHAELRETLAARGMDAGLTDELVDELEGCDFARFSAVGVSGDEMQSCLSRTRGLLEGLDRFRPTPAEDDA